MSEVDASTQGARNRIAGHRWMNRIARELTSHTGLTIKRQLLEVRDGNLGDIEIHERLPLVLEAKNEVEPSLWEALAQANEVAEGKGLYPVALIQRRMGRGRANVRVAGWFADDWKEVAAMLADFHAMRAVVSVTKEGSVYPRVWDGLEEAIKEAQDRHHPDSAMPVCFGVREEGRDVVLQRYGDFLWMVGTAIKEDCW